MFRKTISLMLMFFIAFSCFFGCASDGVSGKDADEMNYPKGEVPKTMKILAIGNSFSVDAMEYLYQLLEEAGVEEIVLGNLYIGGCSIATHLKRAKDGKADYDYYKNTAGVWEKTPDSTFMDGLKDEEWDYISFQQTSKTCGLAETHGEELRELVAIVERSMTNKDAEFMWHMTWAYQADSTHEAFVNYDHSQEKMYEMTADVVKNTVMKLGRFEFVIPAGTAIQNARTSFVGDTLTRDGHHLNKTLGRYIAALTWCAALTGVDVKTLNYAPTDDITPIVMDMAREAVADAIENPYEVTSSSYTDGVWIPKK